MAARKFDRARLDQLVDAAKASERPYKTLEGKPFNLSASVARTVVVGSELSKSAPEVVERERARIAKWLEQGLVGPAKAKQKAAKSKAGQVPESASDTEAAQDESIAIPDAAAAGVDAAYAEAEKARKRASRKPRKDGQPSDTAKAIAKSRNGRVRTRQATP